jgi:hypothetical protein
MQFGKGAKASATRKDKGPQIAPGAFEVVQQY